MTTLGRGGSDLTATTIGKALGLREIQVGHHPLFLHLFCNFMTIKFRTLDSGMSLKYQKCTMKNYINLIKKKIMLTVNYVN